MPAWAALALIRIAMLLDRRSEFQEVERGPTPSGWRPGLISSLALAMSVVYFAHAGECRWHPLSHMDQVFGHLTVKSD